jgi:outer membrane beta-barrel protein
VRKTLLLLCLVPAIAAAQIEELENPGTISAVQDRLFRMNHELTLGVGVLPLDAFYKGLTAQVSYTFHFSDSFAWQVGRGAYSYNVNTSLRTQLERDFSVNPTAFDVVNWMVGSDLVWSPWYGKFSFLNKSVAHFEVYLVGGVSVFRLFLGTVTSGSSSAIGSTFRPAANVGLGIRLFANRIVSWRLDFTNNVLISQQIVNIPTIQLSAALNFGASE